MPLFHDGQIIRGVYEVERFLSEGAFGEVYRVRHHFLGRLAMKVFKVPGMTREEAQDLLSEATLLSRIGHPNIVRVYDADVTETEFGRCAFFTMEYVAAGSLQNHWLSYGSALVPVMEAVDLMRQVCRGLAVAHAETPPLVHRDIKPQNILVGYEADGLRARIADFGLAKRANPLTLMVTAQGTLPFKAPEVFENPKGDSCAGDVWAVGCMLYLLLTDRLPWRQYGPGLKPDRAEPNSKWVPPSHFNLGVDEALDRIAAKALALSPGDRYAEARALLADLESWHPAAPSMSAPPKEAASTVSKTVLGPVSSGDEPEARRKAREALRMARHAKNLHEAADMMEEAFRDYPTLREEYEYRVQLWRRGVMM